MLQKRYSVDTIDHKIPDSVFLSAVSFEERCLNCSSLLSGNYLVEKVVLIRYRGKDKDQKRNKHQSDLMKNFESHLAPNGEVTVVNCDKEDAVDGSIKLKEVLANSNLSEGKITIDITAFTKQYLLVLLKSLKE